jgi:uncharacterized coiled-coil DUF342 family protein
MTVSDWVNNPDRQYTDGVLLFKRNVKDPAMLAMFESGENSMTRRKLLEALREASKPAQVIEITIDGSKKKTIPANQPVNRTKTDAVTAIEQLKGISFKEMAALHAQLTTFKTDRERYEAQHRIVELKSLVDECWYKLDYFQQYGVLPPETEDVSIKTIRDVVQLSKNIPTYFTKINAKLKREDITEEESAELIKQKTKWTLVKQRIDTILDEPIQF